MIHEPLGAGHQRASAIDDPVHVDEKAALHARSFPKVLEITSHVPSISDSMPQKCLPDVSNAQEECHVADPYTPVSGACSKARIASLKPPANEAAQGVQIPRRLSAAMSEPGWGWPLYLASR